MYKLDLNINNEGDSMGAEIVSYLMLILTAVYMVYFVVKVKMLEKKEISMADEDFLLNKKKEKKSEVSDN